MEDKPAYKAKGLSMWLVKSPQGLFHPFAESDYDKAKKIPAGEDNLFVVKRVRNPQFHRKFFALLNLAYDNQDKYNDFDQFRKVVQMKAGYYEAVQTEKSVLYLPKSISYESMDESEFQVLYDKVFVVLSEIIGLKTDEDIELFRNELNQFA